jgi:hypothetical protein
MGRFFTGFSWVLEGNPAHVRKRKIRLLSADSSKQEEFLQSRVLNP